MKIKQTKTKETQININIKAKAVFASVFIYGVVSMVGPLAFWMMLQS